MTRIGCSRVDCLRPAARQAPAEIEEGRRTGETVLMWVCDHHAHGQLSAAKPARFRLLPLLAGLKTR